MRLAVEGIGLILAAAVHVPIFVVYWLGVTLAPFNAYPIVYWTLIGTGYLGLALLLAAARITIGRYVTRRQLLDTSLLTFFGALLVAAGLVYMNWPISLRGWDGHGMGAHGGEGNMLWLPWLHLTGLFVVGRILYSTTRSVPCV